MLPDDDKRYAIETCKSSEKWFKINDIQLVHLLVVWYLVNLQDARCNNKDNCIMGVFNKSFWHIGILNTLLEASDDLWTCQEISHLLRSLTLHYRIQQGQPLDPIMIQIPHIFFKIAFNTFSLLWFVPSSGSYLSAFSAKLLHAFSSLPWMLHSVPIILLFISLRNKYFATEFKLWKPNSTSELDR